MMHLILIVVLLVPTLSQAATRYISPSGSNSNNGQTTSTPWLTFAHALANTSCGDTLLLMNGTYGDGTSTGKLTISKVCTASTIYTVRALNQRQAKVVDNGTSSNAVQVLNGAYIVVDGLYATSADNPSQTTGGGRPFYMADSNHITFRNLVGKNPNRYSNAGLFISIRSQDILLEDLEGYIFHRHCTSGFNNERMVVRRVYCNPRGGKIAGGFGLDQGPIGSGASLFSMYPCRDCILENSIADGTTHPMFLNEMNATFGDGITMSGSKVLGSICYKCNYGNGIVPNARNAEGLNYAPQNILIRDVALIDFDSPSYGIRLIDGVNITIDHVTAMSVPGVGDSTQHGFVASDATSGGAPRGSTPAQNSFVLTNYIATGFAGRGFAVSGFDTWSGSYIFAFNNASNASPAFTDPHWSNTFTTDPGMGTCKLWVPAGAAAKGAGSGGSDIGATILYRYVDGVLTTTPLWDTVTGAFPHGAADVDGTNRVAGESLFDFHTRVNVNSGGCSFPAGYVTGGGSGNTPADPANHKTGSGTTSASWSHTISGQGLLVAVAAYDGGGNVGTINTPTSCGGQSVTAIAGGEIVSSPPYRRIKLFGITSPTTGSCTISTGVTGAADTVVGESVDIASMGSFGTPAVATGLSSAPAVTVPTDDGETVYAFVGTKCLPSGGVCTTTYDVGPDETWQKDTAGVSDLRIASATQSGNDGGAVGATVGTGNYWVIAGVSIIPGSPDPPSGATLTISKYRIESGYGAENGATALAAADTPADMSIFGMARIRVQITGSGSTTPATGVRLYCRRNADAFTQAMNTFGSNTFRLIGPAPEIELPRVPATNTATTEQLTSSSGVFVPGRVYNDANATVVIPSLTVGQQTELVSNVVFDTSAGTMECRYYTDGGVQLPADSGKVPTFTVRAPILSAP